MYVQQDICCEHKDGGFVDLVHSVSYDHETMIDYN